MSPKTKSLNEKFVRYTGPKGEVVTPPTHGSIVFKRGGDPVKLPFFLADKLVKQGNFEVVSEDRN